jgi:hypothetical protein
MLLTVFICSDANMLLEKRCVAGRKVPVDDECSKTGRLRVLVA